LISKGINIKKNSLGARLQPLANIPVQGGLLINQIDLLQEGKNE